MDLLKSITNKLYQFAKVIAQGATKVFRVTKGIKGIKEQGSKVIKVTKGIKATKVSEGKRLNVGHAGTTNLIYNCLREDKQDQMIPYACSPLRMIIPVQLMTMVE